MFKIFTHKELSIITVVLCFIMLINALFNAVSVTSAVSAETGIKVPVIMYHQISEDVSIQGDYAIPLSLLEKDFEYIKNNNINPVSFKQLSDFTEKGIPLPDNPVVITFDDGQKSFIVKVLPLLEKYDYPANVNIVGALTVLYTENGDNNPRYAYLNKEDVKLLSTNPLIEIGCHTYNLHSLAERRGAGRIKGETDTRYTEVITEDLLCFENLFYELTTCKPHIFAYPYGIRSDFLLQMLKDRNYTVTLSCRESVNVLNVGSSLYDLGRFNRPLKLSTENFFGKLF